LLVSHCYLSHNSNKNLLSLCISKAIRAIRCYAANCKADVVAKTVNKKMGFFCCKMV